ncbi:MAG: tetratricopeptide repeat protein [Planctomycetaceae bacterium]
MGKAGTGIAGAGGAGRRGVWLGLALAVAGLAGWWWWPRGTPGDLLNAAWQKLEAGDITATWSAVRELRQRGDSPAEAELLSAAILLRSGKPGEALPLLKEPGSQPATTVRAFTLMAECYSRLGRPAEAVQAAQEALRKDPQALAADRWLAASAYDLGAIDLAADSLRRLSRGIPSDARPDRLLALIQKDSGHPEQAVAHYRESLLRQPDPVDAQQVWQEYAECLLDTQQPQAALDILAPAEASVVVELLRARAHAGLGDTQSEAAALGRARTAAAGDLGVLLASARFALREGALDEALQWGRAAVAGHPHDSMAHYVLGQALERAGEANAARAQFDLFQQWRDQEERFATLHAEASREIENTAIRMELGELAERLRKPELAKTWYRAALSLNPRLNAAQQALDRLERASPGPPP